MSASVVPCVDAPPVLKASEHILDLVALAVEDRIVAVLYAVAGVGRNAWRDAAIDERLAEGRGTVRPVGQQEAGDRQVLDHCGGSFVIVGLPFAHMQKSRAPLAVADHLQLGGQAASAAPDTSG